MSKTAAPDRYGLVGHPVHHSRSPMIHSRFARDTGERLTYELFDAAPSEFEATVHRFVAEGGKGLNVTVPHKEAAYRLAPAHGKAAKVARAVNTLTAGPHGLTGDNTDGAGFLRDLTVNLGCPIEGRRILVLGAGGAARGIVPPLLAACPASLVVANRTLERAENLRRDFAFLGTIDTCGYPELDTRDSFEIIINATSSSLAGELPPLPASVVDADSFCYDLAYTQGETPFVAWARGYGAGRAEQGWGMLVEQAAESFRLWRGIRPETAKLIAELAAGTNQVA